MALVLAPAMIAIGARIRIPSARIPFLVALGAIVVAFGVQALYLDLGATEWPRIFVHATYTAGGIAFAVTCWQVRRHVIEHEELTT